jgi:hypothetical protein
MQSISQSTSEAHKRELFVLDRTLVACRPQIQDRNVRFGKERRAQCIWTFRAPVEIEGFQSVTVYVRTA